MKISCWTLFIMLSFCGAKIVFFTVKQTKFQLVFVEVPYSWQFVAMARFILPFVCSFARDSRDSFPRICLCG